MSPNSPSQSTAGASREEAKLPRLPEQLTLTEDSLSIVCAALASSLHRAHDLFLEGLKSSKCPAVIIRGLSIEGGALALSDQEREAILHLSQESLRASGSSFVAGLVDFIGYARQFRGLASPPQDQGGATTLARRQQDTTYLINALGKRLIISLSTATSSIEKQLSLTALSGVIRACDPIFRGQGAELEAAMNAALAIGAEAPAWSRER